MGMQPKFREQQSSDVFADGRADRLPVAGTVARGSLEEDDHYFRGFAEAADASGNKTAKFFDAFPDRVKLTADFLKRGQQRFNIYCAPAMARMGTATGPCSRMWLRCPTASRDGRRLPTCMTCRRVDALWAISTTRSMLASDICRATGADPSGGSVGDCGLCPGVAVQPECAPQRRAAGQAR